ncbi:hypothetical protein NESM_000494400 [Novymonas esmeraldas]|uniref:Uncharacterized protein n=1 Tax=Novymonas esmeraldas TaxID=1808958 RepID=A0AAW0EQI9_9TRYP
MALSYHVVIAVYLPVAVADVVLLSIRTLVSRHYYSLTLCYALMGVQEALLVLELLAVLGQLLSTYLVSAGMWRAIASLLGGFAPLWLLRAFLSAFAMVYKDILLYSTLAAGAVSRDGVPATRAWQRSGYAAVVCIDVACCVLYYLTAVYVLGYLSDKTLYVPYHRRRWRHLQWKRACETTAATAAAEERRKRRRHERADEPGGGSGAAAALPPTAMSLARTASFAQWDARARQRHVEEEEAGQQRHDDVVGDDDPGRWGRDGGGDDGVRCTSPRPSPSAALAPHLAAPAGARGREHSDASDASGGAAQHRELSARPSGAPATAAATSRTTALPPHGEVAQPRQGRASADPSRGSGAGSPVMPRSVPSLFANLPPLRLQRRFTLSHAEGEEKQLHHFATALVEHGYTSASSPIGKSAPELPTSPSRDALAGGTGARHTPTSAAPATSASLADTVGHTPLESAERERVSVDAARNPFSWIGAATTAAPAESIAASTPRVLSPPPRTAPGRLSVSLLTATATGSVPHHGRRAAPPVLPPLPPPPLTMPSSSAAAASRLYEIDKATGNVVELCRPR